VSKPTLRKVVLRTGLEPTPASPLTERIVWGFVALGCLLRLRQFLFDRALWNDESMLALNLIHRSPAELLRPLEYDQGAPIGFLLLEKMAQLSFGSSEMALRFLPLVCGIAFHLQSGFEPLSFGHGCAHRRWPFRNCVSLDLLLYGGEAIFQRRCHRAHVVSISRFPARDAIDTQSCGCFFYDCGDRDVAFIPSCLHCGWLGTQSSLGFIP
jgi:hypothetical protein